MNRKSKVKISVVMPALNEEKTIGTCIRKAKNTFKKHNIKNFEIVIADNGSTDKTVQIAKREGARIVFQPKRGYGNAYMKGIESARGDYIIIGDSDDSYDFTDVMRFLNPLINEGYDMVMGTRFKGGKIMRGAMPWHHKYIGNPVLSGILNIFFRTGVSDAHCGMRSFTKKAYKQMNLKMPGMEFASEMVINAARAGLKIKEIPITLYKDGRGGKASHLHSLRDGWRHLRLMLLYSPTWLFFIPGITLFILGILTFIFVQIGFPIMGHPLGKHFSSLGILLVILGTQIITLGIYAKIYSYNKKVDTNDRFIKKFFHIFKLERGIFFGTACIIVGLLMDALILFKWINEGFGALEEFNTALIASALIVIGFQIIFGSFFIGLIKMEKEM